MGILGKLRELFSGGGAGSGGQAPDPNGLWLHFKCDKCGAVVRIRADKRNDLNREGGPGTFLLRKEVMDSKCFQLIEATVWLDSNYSVVSSDVTGGELISAEEYAAAQAPQPDSADDAAPERLADD